MYIIFYIYYILYCMALLNKLTTSTSRKAVGRFFIHIFLILKKYSFKPTIARCLGIVTKFWPLPEQCDQWSISELPVICKYLSDDSFYTYLEGVKISLQFPNNEIWWVSKSTFQGLKKYVFQKNRPRAFRENWLKPLKN